jgi:hypothetical protein
MILDQVAPRILEELVVLTEVGFPRLDCDDLQEELLDVLPGPLACCPVRVGRVDAFRELLVDTLRDELGLVLVLDVLRIALLAVVHQCRE